MELYHWPMSHNARKARALARHLGVAVQEVPLSMQDKDHKADSFLAINPMGQVPAIKDDDYTVWEANAVLIYLAAQSPNDLLGQSAQEWGHITQWMTWQSVELSPVVVPLHVENHFKRVRGIDADAVKRDAAKQKLRALLKILDDTLDGKDHLVGDRLTVADFAVAGDFTHARNAHFPLSEYPNVARWLKGIETLPAWADTTPPQIG
ncbi:glutathione S-transferase family protein [Cognatiyoonia sp. IB215446]|uniref:glutathione S-transferase family protein n=1 Tax=Cognatiyoonia sp. IB215446 TaxID=3097355 RepID=UPI002A1020B6|nr:glutathione S-transferase family protein [Cognatiyoonia sp. IB215446]MDX8346972.1 glutathione S-transferase family protein [Cognatiyoonia sp. IB215446]